MHSKGQGEALLALFRDGTPADWAQFAIDEKSFPQGTDYVGAPWVLVVVTCGSPAAVKWMIDAGAKINFRDNTGDTVFHSCIERKDNDQKYAILELLIAAGGDIEIVGYNGWAPLHVAAVRNDQRSAEILLKAGADKTQRTPIDDCATPAEEALSFGHKKLAKFIENFS